jgi:hypothetical protein
MNIDIRDAQAMTALQPLEVSAYLRSRGWAQRPAGAGAATIWTLTVAGDGYDVLLPLDPSVRDVALRMGDILRVLATAEERSQEGIYADLLTKTAGHGALRGAPASRDKEISAQVKTPGGVGSLDELAPKPDKRRASPRRVGKEKARWGLSADTGARAGSSSACWRASWGSPAAWPASPTWTWNGMRAAASG